VLGKVFPLSVFVLFTGVALFFAISSAPATISAFQHIILIVQENRTPDNLFFHLCAAPYGSPSSCSTHPSSSQYNIQTANWLNKKTSTGVTQPIAGELVSQYDLGHDHPQFVAQCDETTAGVCQMDGAGFAGCLGACPDYPQYHYVSNSGGVIDPYLKLATQYGWANYMFQTNQGSSFPAHQFLFGGTSAPSAADDANGTFVSDSTRTDVGCAAPSNVTVPLLFPSGTITQIYPCFEHSTMVDVLPVTWKYYAVTANWIWTAPDAIQHLCQSTGPGGQCTSQQWTQNVDLTPADVLRDITSCKLASMVWVTPTAANSDHPLLNEDGGPSWVASIVNAIGTSCGYWTNTAILVTWDDWGGWYDHEAPTILPAPQGDYQYGFRVPFLFVSAYTPAGYIDNNRHDFGSILRFAEKNFGIREGALNFADARSSDDLSTFYDFASTPRSFMSINARLSARDFLNDKRPPKEPDTD
jgi:phospholipase C